MKILYLHQYFNTPEMKSGTRSYEFARRMVLSGHQVDMLASDQSGNAVKGWSHSNESGINVHWYSVKYSNSLGHIQRVKAFFIFAYACLVKVKQLKPDVVYASSTPLTIAIPGVFAARYHKVPLVFEVRDLWPEMPIAMGALKNPLAKIAARWLERWAYKHSSAVVALSPGMKDGVVRAGFPEDKVAVIPNSCDIEDFAYDLEQEKSFRQARAWLKSDPLLVYTGAFGRMNGVGYLVDLAQELNRIGSNVKLLAVSDGAERDAVIARAKEVGVYGDNFFYEPPVLKKDIPAIFSAASMGSNLVLDIPEARANSANKFFDTLASGKPVFVNHGGWMHQIVGRY